MIGKLLFSSLLLLFAINPIQYKVYRVEHIGYFEVYINGEYIQSTRSYIEYNSYEKYLCFFPQGILNSGKEAKVMVCHIEQNIQMIPYTPASAVAQ
jgi:hypothetical protein